MNRANTILTRISQTGITPGSMIVGLPSNEKSGVVGNPYLDNHWGESSLLLYENDGAIKGYFTKYDIYNDEFEFRLGNEVKVLIGSKVKNIVWKDSLSQNLRYLVNAKEYHRGGTPLTGFLEILVDGNNSLLKRISVTILKPDYNPARDVGHKDSRIVKKETYYYNIKNELIEIKSKKDFERIFLDKTDQMSVFIKNEKLKYNKEADLIRMFKFFLGLKT